MADSKEKSALLVTAGVQLTVTISCACTAAFIDSMFFGVSVLWGGLAASVSLLLLAWRLFYGDEPTFKAEQHLRLMYRSSMERFFVVAAWLAIGMLKLKLLPLAVLLGFLVGQVTLVVVPIIRGIIVK